MKKPEKIRVQVLTAYVMNDELNLVLNALDSEQSGILTFATKSWDESAKALVDDPIIKAQTDEQLMELFNLSFDDIVANPLILANMELEAYWDDAYQKFRLTEPKSYLRFDMISPENVKAVKSFANSLSEDNAILSTPVEDHYGVRIKLGIEIPDVGRFRISNLSNGINKGKLNYATSKLQVLKQSLDDEKDPETKETLQLVYDSNIKSSKAKVLADLQNTFGIDFKELMEIGGYVRISGLEVRDFSTGASGQIAYYLIGELSEDQDIEENKELRQKYQEAKELEDEE